MCKRKDKRSEDEAAQKQQQPTKKPFGVGAAAAAAAADCANDVAKIEPPNLVVSTELSTAGANAVVDSRRPPQHKSFARRITVNFLGRKSKINGGNSMPSRSSLDNNNGCATNDQKPLVFGPSSSNTPSDMPTVAVTSPEYKAQSRLFGIALLGVGVKKNGATDSGGGDGNQRPQQKHRNSSSNTNDMDDDERSECHAQPVAPPSKEFISAPSAAVSTTTTEPGTKVGEKAGAITEEKPKERQKRPAKRTEDEEEKQEKKMPLEQRKEKPKRAPIKWKSDDEEEQKEKEESSVDQKKLAKAEGKAKEKAQKRADGGGESGGKTVRKARPQVQATASQAMNRRDAKGEVGTMDVKLENVDISFGNKQLISSADLLLVFGHRYGLVGRNGIGKTTLLKMLSCKQLVIPSNITMLSVEQEVEGDETPVIDAVLASDTRREALLAEERQLQAKINSADVSDDERSVFSARLDALYTEQQSLQLDKAPARAATILFGLGFKPDEQRKPTREFSGGWRMRVALARALFIKPDLLLLDEPTNMLDMRAVYWLENHLQEWHGTILTVSHDRKFLNTVCTDIVHLHSRRLDAYKGNYDNFEKAMREKLTLQQREYEAQQQLRQHIQEFIDKFRYNAKRASMVQSRIKMLEKLPVLQPVEFDSDVVFHFKDCDKLGNPVLQLDEVAFRYSKETPYIFQKVCIGSRSDSRICIVGENGAGKTTLLKLLLGDHSPTNGTRSANRRLNIGYFTQHHVDQLDLDDSPLELLAQRFPGLGQEEYRAAMGRFGLSGDIAFQSIATLSGGQKSRLAFTCLSLQQPNYLVMDEPTNHLDVETVDALGKALNDFKGGVVLVSHDERLIELVCKELWVCKDKTVTQLDGGLEEYKKHVYRQLAIQ